MLPIISKLPYLNTATKKFGQSKGLAIYIIVAIVVVIIIVKGGQAITKAIKDKLSKWRDQNELREYTGQQVYVAADGIVPSESEVQIFQSQAQFIADAQQSAMEAQILGNTVSGTNEETLFYQLKPLKGWELVLVADAFGLRSYPGGGDLSIFEWYDQDLCDSCTWCLNYEDEEVEGCKAGQGSYWCNECSERNFMRKIWMNSGIPN
jgi:hypothetical protein